jgi:D,D-heptose 1,7-bisphosphate phosphatase
MGENRDRVDTPECHARIRAEHVSHLSERQSTGDSRTAVFLDRDGTLNVEVNRLRSVDQLELIPGAADAVRSLNRAGFLAVVVTNQAAIARGDCSEADLEQIHDKLESLLGEHGAYLDAIYYCPHHPDRGSPGERAELKIECDCRKPGTAMIERAASDFPILMEESWMIGDTTVDLQTAQNARIRSILVRTGYAGRDQRWSARPDFEFSDLKEAVEFVTEMTDRS